MASDVGRPAPSSGGLSVQDRQIALRFKQRLAATCALYRVCVFGSRARGDATWESDLDVLVVLEGDNTPAVRQHIAEVAWEVGFESGVVIAPVVAARGELEGGVLAESPLFKQIAAEGVAI